MNEFISQFFSLYVLVLLLCPCFIFPSSWSLYCHLCCHGIM